MNLKRGDTVTCKLNYQEALTYVNVFEKDKNYTISRVLDDKIYILKEVYTIEFGTISEEIEFSLKKPEEYLIPCPFLRKHRKADNKPYFFAYFFDYFKSEKYSLSKKLQKIK